MAIAVIVALGIVVIPGCGGATDGDKIEDRLTAVQVAFDAGDLRTACQGMTERAKLLIGFMAHSAATTCPLDLRRVRGWMADGERSEIGPAPRVVDVNVDGRHAKATVEQPGSPPYSVRLARRGDDWKLDGVFDAGASTFQEFSDVPPDRGPPPGPVTSAAAPVGAPTCEPTCEIEAQSPMRLTVLNAFGRMFLSKCTIHFTLRVDADGSTTTNDFYAAGENACGDVRACATNQTNTRHRAWNGQIERTSDGKLRHRFVDVCLDTCVGEYRGDWAVGIERRGTGWRLQSDSAMVGTTGWLFDGAILAKGGDIGFEL